MEGAEYQYLASNEFTSEIYKIEVKNLIKYASVKDVKKKLATLGLFAKKVKIMEKVSFVTFNCQEQVDLALEKLQNFKYKGRELAVKYAKPRSDPFADSTSRKRELEASSSNDVRAPKSSRKSDDVSGDGDGDDADADAKEDAEEDDVTPRERICAVVMSFAKKPYENQLIAKQNKTRNVMLSAARRIGARNRDLRARLFDPPDSNSETTLQIEPIVPSPSKLNYRNKCEFTIGTDLDGTFPSIGFCYGKYRGGFDGVFSQSSRLEIVPDLMAQLVERLTSLLSDWCNPQQQQEQQQSSDDATSAPIRIPVYNAFNKSGILKGITIRLGDEFDEEKEKVEKEQKEEKVVALSSSNHSAMLIVELYRTEQFVAQNVDAFSAALCAHFEADSRVSSILLAVRSRPSDPLSVDNTRVLRGDRFVWNVLCGKRFRISFNAFFQVNRSGAEQLYERIRTALPHQHDVTQQRRRLVLLDLCCGSGAIGICLADSVRRVIGVELCAEAVEDARHNAQLNSLPPERVEFRCGRVEHVINDVIRDVEQSAAGGEEEAAGEGTEVVAVVDPPRCGLNSSVSYALRKCRALKQLIFVSCNPDAAVRNFVELCSAESKRIGGVPFVPVRAIPVDMFPQTPHIELIVVFERCRE